MMQVQHSTRELTIQERKKLCDLLDREEAVFDAREHARVELVQSVGFCRILQKLLELTKNTFAQIAIARPPLVFPTKNALRHQRRKLKPAYETLKYLKCRGVMRV